MRMVMANPTVTGSGYRLIDFDRYPEHIVTHPKEVDLILRGLVSQRALLALFVQNTYLFPTVLLGLDDKEVYLDVARDESLNQRVAGNDIVCQGKQDGVTVQFALRRPTIRNIANGRAFAAPRPDALLRLQRREFFRLRVPMSHNVICKINVAAPGTPPRYYPLRVLDISSGGVAVMAPPHTLRLTEGQRFPDSQLVIPTAEPFTLTLEVRNVFHITNRSGQLVERIGCRFVDLPLNIYTALQRYIFTAQRELQRLQAQE